MPKNLLSSASTRRRGGQPGNGNALGQGLYSKYFTRIELDGLAHDLKGEFKDELEFAQVQLVRIAQLLLNKDQLSTEQFLAASHVGAEYLDRIQRLKRAQRFLYNNQTDLAQAIRALSQIPPEQD